MKYDIDPSYQNNGKFAKGLKIQKLGNGWKKTGKNPVQPVNQILETELVRFSVFGCFFPDYYSFSDFNQIYLKMVSN